MTEAPGKAADMALAGLTRLRERLDTLCLGWRGQLASLARTVLYAAAGRLRNTVDASLN